MQTTHNNSILPYELYPLIHRHADVKTKKKLSTLNVMINHLCAQRVHSIQLLPSSPDPKKPLSSHSVDVLVRLIKRYSNASTLILGKKNQYFSLDEKNQLQFLIAYLESNNEKHPLSHIKNLVLFELKESHLDSLKAIKEKQTLTRHLTRSLSHANLKSIAIQMHLKSSLTHIELQPILENPLKLKKFKLIGAPFNTINISLEKQKRLISAKFVHCQSPTRETLLSLTKCHRLNTLILKVLYGNPIAKDFLISETLPWKLKRLALDSHLKSKQLDVITKKFTSLENLSAYVYGDALADLKVIGENCPKLRIFKFKCQSISDDAVNQVTMKLPLLKEFSLCVGDFSITGKGVNAILTNCKKLRTLNMNLVVGLKAEELAKSGNKLRVLELGQSILSIEDFRYLAQTMTELSALRINLRYWRATEERLATIRTLKTEFPHFFK